MSIRSKYKYSVQYYLMKDYGWESKRALDWLREHTEYLDAMRSSCAPTSEVAEWISKMKENNDNSN